MENTKDRNKINYNQILLILMGYRIMVGLTYMPAVNVPPRNQDIWLVLLLSIVYVLILNIPLVYLINRFSNLNLLELTEKIMGNVLGKLIGVFYLFTFLFSNILFLSTLIEILNSVLFPLTPTWFNTSLALFTCSYIVFKGLKTLARLFELLIPIIILITFFLIILGFENYNFKELLPIFKDSTIMDINKGAINIALRFFDILVLAMISPSIKEKSKINKIFIKSTVYSTFITTLIILTTQMTLGIEFAKHVNFPFLTFTRTLFIGEIQGFDSIYIISWIMGNILRVAGYMYCTKISLEQIINKKSQKFIGLIFVIMLAAVVFIKNKRSILAVPEPTDTITLIVSIISVVVIPIIISIVYLCRKKTLNEL